MNFEEHVCRDKEEWPKVNQDIMWMYIERIITPAGLEPANATNVRLWGERREGGVVVFVLCSFKRSKSKSEIDRMIQDAEDIYGVKEWEHGHLLSWPR